MILICLVCGKGMYMVLQVSSTRHLNFSFMRVIKFKKSSLFFPYKNPFTFKMRSVQTCTGTQYGHIYTRFIFSLFINFWKCKCNFKEHFLFNNLFKCDLNLEPSSICDNYPTITTCELLPISITQTLLVIIIVIIKNGSYKICKNNINFVLFHFRCGSRKREYASFSYIFMKGTCLFYLNNTYKFDRILNHIYKMLGISVISSWGLILAEILNKSKIAIYLQLPLKHCL